MKEISENVDFRQIMSEMLEKYYHWDKFRRIPIPSNFSHEELWEYIRYSREITSQNIDFAGKKFSFNLHNVLLQNLHFIDLHFGGTLAGKIISQNKKEQFLKSSLIEEAIASSQIE